MSFAKLSLAELSYAELSYAELSYELKGSNTERVDATDTWGNVSTGVLT